MTKRFYLPGLDGIRAIACLMVYYTHFNHELGTTYSFAFHDIELGSSGVTCFFTLSGFLITTLLLQEKTRTKGIDLKSFYIRRILRIWPLYFLILLIGLIIYMNFRFPGETLSNFLFYIFFIGNLGYSMGRAIWSVNVLWSVGVEEQFYAFWPFIIRSKKVWRSIWLVILVYLLIKMVLRFVGPQSIAYSFWGRTHIDSMAIGGLFAYLRFTGSPYLKIFYNKAVQVLVWMVFAWSFISLLHVTSSLDTEVYSIVIGIIILNVSNAPTTLLTLENPILKYIGKISYGVYAYHMVIIILWGHYVPASFVARLPHPNYILPFLLLGSTLLTAHISYFYFERFFLVRKEKYSALAHADSKKPVITTPVIQ